MADLTPRTAPTAHDIFTLDGLASPGLSRIEGGGDRVMDWQDQQAPGFAGAFSFQRFEKIATVTYLIELWEDEHFLRWEAWIAMLNEGRQRRPPRAYTLVDLRLSHNAITTVGLESCSAQKLIRPTVWGYSLTFHEFRKRQPVGGPLRPPDRQDVELERLNAEAKALDAQLAGLEAAHRAGK
jgi:hypothetical protein